MDERTEGIVIKQIDYKDNDAIITVYTRDYDRLSFYVRGYNKITSKNVYATQLFDESEFHFDMKQFDSMQILKTAKLKDPREAIKADYEKLTIASLIAQICDQLLTQGCYELLKDAMDNLEKSDQPYTVLNVFLAQALKETGIGPNVDGCSICDRTDSIEAISIEDGGFVCHSCNQNLHLPLADVETLKKFRYVNKASFAVFDRLADLKLNDFGITKLLMSYISTFLEVEFSSYRALLNLNK